MIFRGSESNWIKIRDWSKEEDPVKETEKRQRGGGRRAGEYAEERVCRKGDGEHRPFQGVVLKRGAGMCLSMGRDARSGSP